MTSANEINAMKRGREQVKEAAINRFNGVAADKAEKLRELGHGQPPILFEIKEIISIIESL